MLRSSDIFFTRADKGNVTVAINRDMYNEKMLVLLNDKDTYDVIKRSFIIEKKLNNLLKEWLKKNYINKKDYFSLRSSDVSLPKTYGLPKIHKNNYPLRMIVSSTNSALYNFASFLNNIICNNFPHLASYVMEVLICMAHCLA